MTMSNPFGEFRLHRTGLEAHSWWAVVANSIRRQIEWIKHQRQISHDLNRLREFDNRLLADIGVSREELFHVAWYGRRPTRRTNHPGH